MASNKNKNSAKKHCANYGKGTISGICSGVMINRDGRMWLNKDYVGKQCFADKECNYFNNIVIPGIPAHG
jgi:hypothetical protein